MDISLVFSSSHRDVVKLTFLNSLDDLARIGESADDSDVQLIKLLSRPPLEKLTPEDFLSDPTPAGLAKKLDGTVKA